jgi:hypothetical protein
VDFVMNQRLHFWQLVIHSVAWRLAIISDVTVQEGQIIRRL